MRVDSANLNKPDEELSCAADESGVLPRDYVVIELEDFLT